MKPNRYIKAMEIGLAHEKEGISYNNLISEVQKQTKDMGIHAEATFYYWFVDSFSSTNFDPKLSTDWKTKFEDYYRFKHGIVRPLSSSPKVGEPLYKLLDNKKWFLNGQAAKQYLDYVEYKSARESSRNAQIAAIISILIAASSFYFTYQATKETPKPPYDVKVIENDAQTKELQEVKERLYKAEMMLKVYESDSLPSS